MLLGEQFWVCAPGRIRTCDLRIRSPLLYPLSYERLAAQRRLPPGYDDPSDWTGARRITGLPDRLQNVRPTSTTFLPVLASVDDDRVLDEYPLDEFLGDLVVGYSPGPPFGERLLSWADIDRFGLSHHALRRHAMDNLDRMLERVRIHGQPPALMLSFEGLESSVLLADAFWQSLVGSVPGELVIGVPARDVVIVTGSESPPGLEKARRAVDRVFFAGDQYLLTRHLLVWRRGAWDVFRPQMVRPRMRPATYPAR
jgi:hypothetical protein